MINALLFLLAGRLVPRLLRRGIRARRSAGAVVVSATHIFTRQPARPPAAPAAGAARPGGHYAKGDVIDI